MNAEEKPPGVPALGTFESGYDALRALAVELIRIVEKRKASP